MPREGGGSPYSFPKHLRLRKEREFKEVFRRGRKIDLGFAVFYLSPNNLGYPRFGIVVSKKVSKKAVIRNRLKRLFREYFRLHKDRFNSKDVVAVVKETIPGLKYLEERLSSFKEF